MDYSVNGQCMFATGVVYRTFTSSYETEKSEEIWLVLGPSTKRFAYLGSHPTTYRYLNLLTGAVGYFHRDSRFAKAAEPL